MKKSRYYFDMDGTLFEWKNIEYFEMLYEKGYYRDLTPNMSLVDAVKQLIAEGEDVYVLSSYLTDSLYALEEKKQSLDKNLPQLPQDKRIFVHYGDDKSKYIDGGLCKNDYLIDDYTKNLVEWEEAGGNGIKFLNEINHSKETWEGKTLSLVSCHTYSEIKQLSENENVKQVPRKQREDTFNKELRLHNTRGNFELRKKTLNVLKETYDIKIINIYTCEDNKILVQYMLNQSSKCAKSGFAIFELPRRNYEKSEEEMKSKVIDLLYGMNISKKSLSIAQTYEYSKIEHFFKDNIDDKSKKISLSDAKILSKYDLKNSPLIYRDYEKNNQKESQIMRKNSTTDEEKNNDVHFNLEEERDIF